IGKLARVPAKWTPVRRYGHAPAKQALEPPRSTTYIRYGTTASENAMARKPARAKADSPESSTRPPTTPPTGSDRERIGATFMALLAEKPIERIDLTE